MHQHRPRPIAKIDGFDPARLGQLDQRDRLDDPFLRLAKERRVRDLPRPPPGSAHALQERANGVGRLGLQHPIQIPHVDPELERGRAHDACVRSVGEAFLGELALLFGHRAVMHEHLGPSPAHVLGDRLGDRPRLTEKQALAALGHARGRVSQARQLRLVHDQQLTARHVVWRIHDDALALRAAPDPSQDRLGVADGRAQTHALHVVARQGREPLDHAQQVRAAVAARERVDLIDHDHPQIPKQPRRVDRLRDQHDLERLRRGHQQLGRLAQELPPLVAGRVAVPHEAPQPDHLRVLIQPLGLVVEQRLDRRDVEGSDAHGLIADHARDRREHAGLGLAACGRGQDHRVATREQSLARELLHRTQ
jgi:hypothetical protein